MEKCANYIKKKSRARRFRQTKLLDLLKIIITVFIIFNHIKFFYTKGDQNN